MVCLNVIMETGRAVLLYSPDAFVGIISLKELCLMGCLFTEHFGEGAPHGSIGGFLYYPDRRRRHRGDLPRKVRDILLQFLERGYLSD